MRRFSGLSLLVIVTGLTGCAVEPSRPAAIPSPIATQPPPPPAPLPPPPLPETAPQQQAAPQPFPQFGAYFTELGLASFYGRAHDGKTTANGKNFDHREFTAAHRTLPFGTLVRVTNLSNGRMVTLQITDRGPRIKTRIIDISLAAARALRMQKKGITQVKVEAFREDQTGRD